MPRVFKGKDRRMGQKFLDVVGAMKRRDERALDMTPTTALSNRVQFFPVMDQDIQDALELLETKVTDLLALNEGDPLPAEPA